ncbi:hypothetical protein [Sinorhizobium meliloti]|uniref:hypothetical protein n=1 Tax=Rhizobium meliloti TaxID=382 RepID=UPI0003F89673|nr:hypothetical protein [Sinorhizobium meliloti]MDE4618390.1 hypothetical protein [Sinorhizobium meliloti]
MVDKAMSDLVTDIQSLDQSHNRGKTLSQDQLAEQVFRRDPKFKKDKEAVPYFRYQLRVATEELTNLDQEMRSKGGGSITVATFTQFSDMLTDYLFDLREILVFLQRKATGWEFFDGGKNSTVTSWEVYLLARGLAFQSTYTGSGSPFDNKTAQIASVFALRQAMELRFERLIAVYPYDAKDTGPRLKHGFHHDFISSHPQFFSANGFRIKELRHLYDWCSEIVHQAYQPYAWQISMAMRRAGDLLHTRSAPANQAWSIFNAVTISDTEAMQGAYEDYFLSNYGHGVWRFLRDKPEALLPAWRPEMAFMGIEARPVKNRPSLWKRIRNHMIRWMRKLL